MLSFGHNQPDDLYARVSGMPGSSVSSMLLKIGRIGASSSGSSSGLGVLWLSQDLSTSRLRLRLQGDFTVIMKTLQRYPPLDVNILLEHASKLPPCSELGMPL